MSRAQHIIPSGIIALIGAWVAWISFTQEPADAFLFPRLISTAFLILALWTFGKALLGMSKVGQGLSMRLFVNMAPGLVVGGIYIFWAAKALGFYAASTIAFFTLLSLYDPASHRDARTWVKRAITTIVFIAVMYGLFAMLLKVYTPRGLII